MKLLILVSLLGASFAWAQAKDDAVQYNERPGTPFAEWVAKYPREHQVLGLFKNYAEPTFTENGKTDVRRLTMYTNRVRISINKVASQINLPNLITIESLQNLDRELKHKVISANQAMPNVVGKGPIDNFKWCTKQVMVETQMLDVPYIALPGYERDLSFLKGDRPWCANDGRTLCVESCFPFNARWSTAVQGYNVWKTAKKMGNIKQEELKDEGMGMQIEARYFTSDAEYGQNLQDLTGVKSPIRGIVELNIFFVNQVIQYGKVLAVFQEHPQSAQATVVTTVSAYAIVTKSWDKKEVREALQGKSSENTKTGLTAGIPTFTKNIAKSLASMLENAK